MYFKLDTLKSNYIPYLTEQGLTEKELPFNQYVRKVSDQDLIVTKSNDGTESFRLFTVLGIDIEHGDGFIQIDNALEGVYYNYLDFPDKEYYKIETFIDYLTILEGLVIGSLDNLDSRVSTIIIDSENGFDFCYVVDPKGNVYEYLNYRSGVDIEAGDYEVGQMLYNYLEYLNDNFLTTEYLPFEDFLIGETDKELVVEGNCYYLAESGEKLFVYDREISFKYSEDFEPYIHGYEDFLIENELSCSGSRFEEYLDDLIGIEELLLNGVKASYEFDHYIYTLVKDEPED